MSNLHCPDPKIEYQDLIDGQAIRRVSTPSEILKWASRVSNSITAFAHSRCIRPLTRNSSRKTQTILLFDDFCSTSITIGQFVPNVFEFKSCLYHSFKKMVSRSIANYLKIHDAVASQISSHTFSESTAHLHRIMTKSCRVT